MTSEMYRGGARAARVRAAPPGTRWTWCAPRSTWPSCSSSTSSGPRCTRPTRPTSPRRSARWRCCSGWPTGCCVGEADQGRIAVLAWRISRIARSRSARTAVAARPSRAAAYVLAHGCLHQLGCRDDSFDELARAALTSSAANACERVPHRLAGRRLDPAPAARRRRARPSGARALADRAWASTWSATTVEDAYAFSHALPYATDFGRRAAARRPSTPPGCPASPTRWCSRRCDEDDLDLLGELLMAPALLRRDWSPVQWFGWRVLCDTWGRYGFVPGPGLPPPVEGEDAAETVRRVLGTVYHTTLVGGLAVATLVSAGRAAPATPPSGPACVAPRGRPARTTSRAWLRTWHALDDDEREALAAVPAGHGAAPRRRRHRRRRDRRVPEQPVRRRPCPEPLVTQAAELVNRLALLVGRPDPPGDPPATRPAPVKDVGERRRCR